MTEDRTRLVVGDVEPTSVETHDIDGMEAALRARRAAVAIHRRALLVDEHSLVKRDPKDMASAIALGFVLVRRGLRAVDSWRLDGLLSNSLDDLVARLTAASSQLDDQSAGGVLVRAIDLGAAELAAKGQYVAWLRQAKRYFVEHDDWLAADAALRDSGIWRDRSMSSGQQELIRMTCALLELDLPGHLLRGTAHDWLEQHGASLRYRGVAA